MSKRLHFSKLLPMSPKSKKAVWHACNSASETGTSANCLYKEKEVKGWNQKFLISKETQLLGKQKMYPKASNKITIADALDLVLKLQMTKPVQQNLRVFWCKMID